MTRSITIAFIAAAMTLSAWLVPGPTAPGQAPATDPQPLYAGIAHYLTTTKSVDAALAALPRMDGRIRVWIGYFTSWALFDASAERWRDAVTAASSVKPIIGVPIVGLADEIAPDLRGEFDWKNGVLPYAGKLPEFWSAVSNRSVGLRGQYWDLEYVFGVKLLRGPHYASANERTVAAALIAPALRSASASGPVYLYHPNTDGGSTQYAKKGRSLIAEIHEAAGPDTFGRIIWLNVSQYYDPRLLPPEWGEQPPRSRIAAAYPDEALIQFMITGVQHGYGYRGALLRGLARSDIVYVGTALSKNLDELGL